MAPLLTALVWTFLFCGGGTWYDNGEFTRDGTEFEVAGRWVAVDTAYYAQLRGQTLYFTGGDAWAILPVRDSGRLSEADVALDFPKETFRQLFEDLDTQHVCVWVVGRKVRQKRRIELWRTW